MLHGIVVLLDGGLDEFLAPFLDEVGHVGRRFLDLVGSGVARVIPHPGLARQQVDHAREIVFDANGQRHDQRVGRQHILDLLYHAVEIRAHAVHLVDENNARHFRFVGVTPVGLGLGLHTAGATEYAHTTVEHFERAIHFDGEVDVSGRVDNVQAVAVPLAGGGGGLDGNTALAFLVHEVGGGFTLVNLSGFVDLPGQLQNAFRGRCLAGINVGENANVSVI